jgi:ABC-type polysaccharide/polyol phosphate export permease
MIAYSRQTVLLTWRSLRAIPRVPERLLDVTVQPVVFILLFLYVFGSAIHYPHVPYKDYLFPGVIAQSMAFGIFGAGTATASDMSEGVIDRFRSMPINRLSIISGQVLGQMTEQLLGIAITVGLGLILGWTPHLSFVQGLELAGIILLSLAAFTWVGVLFGLIVRVPEAVQGIGFVIVFPLSFMAGTFVKISGMVQPFRAIADWDPISAFVAAVRGLTTPEIARSTGSWQLEHPEIAAVAWCLILMGIAIPLALRRFNRRIAA